MSEQANNELHYDLPSKESLVYAAKLSIVEDKPIMLDYWTASLDKKVVIGVRESDEKILVKSEDEYTSTVTKFFKSKTEIMVVTENSIYIVSRDTPSRRIK